MVSFSSGWILPWKIASRMLSLAWSTNDFAAILLMPNPLPCIFILDYM